MQRPFACVGWTAPLITVVEVTFHCPGSMRFSAANVLVAAGRRPSPIAASSVPRRNTYLTATCLEISRRESNGERIKNRTLDCRK
jgi:hypothetical protein